MLQSHETEVLVVGGGLTGLSCALFLAHHGVRCTLVERHPDLLSHPRQRSLVPRLMEIYRQVGLEPRIHQNRVDFATSTEYTTIRAETLASARYLPVDQQDDAARTAAFSPCTGTPIDQNRVEALLRTRARELGVRIRFGTELLGLARHEGGVEARLRDLDGTAHRLVARYAVAADGGRSPVRHALGIPMEGPVDFFRLLTLMVDADLRPALAGRTVHMAFLDRPRPRTYLMALDRTGRRWVFGTTDGPGDAAPDEDECVELVRAAAGLPTVPVVLRPQIPGTDRTVLRFEVGAAVAATYRKGPVFLIGDAAHLMPPTGGFGGVVGVEDAHNLAWKLAAVVRGHAGEGLLDTYEDERRPVAAFALRQALTRYRSRLAAGAGPAELPMADEEPVDRSTVMMGHRYRSTAVAGGASDATGVASGASDATAPAEVSGLCGDPGTRAPHLPLAGPGGRSTIDLYGGRFVLLAGPDGQDWVTAAGKLPLPVTARRFGNDLAAAGTSAADAAARHGIGAGGAVLVRPDGFVAWRSTGPATDPAAELLAAFTAILSATG
ncbi:FAD-dependent oxidoreductase [Nonomuraea sp. NPDC050786]|uniref:FAD-dependent oxidoreductase n=1 Tax=Nonomuraea sp. NPDC050786 TaxID=3154840 RepID=UPI0033CA5F14